MPPPKLPTETEIKLRVESVPALLRVLKQLRARQVVPRVHEFNTLFDTADRSLYRSGKIIRIRTNRVCTRRSSAIPPRVGKKSVSHAGLLTYKGPCEPFAGGRKKARMAVYKVRHELEVGISDTGQVAQILASLGLHPVFRYEKFRTTYALPGVKGVHVELDETPLGPFLELEGTSVGIDRAASRLGFSRADYITASYGELNQAASRGPGRPVGDLLFNAARKPR